MATYQKNHRDLGPWSEEGAAEIHDHYVRLAAHGEKHHYGALVSKDNDKFELQAVLTCST